MSENLPEALPQQETMSQRELESAIQDLRNNQSLTRGVVAGLVAAAIGAAVWALVTVLTGYQIGWMAIGVGFLVGFTVQKFGKGIDPIFGVIGAGFALLGCLAGNFFSICGFIAKTENLPLIEVLTTMDITTIPSLMVSTFNVMDLLFYAIAIYEGYRISFRN